MSSENIILIQDYIEKKVERNNIFMKCLELESKIWKKHLVFYYRLVKNNENRINFVQQINELERKTFTDESKSIKQEIDLLTYQVDNSKIDISDIIQDLKRLITEKQILVELIQKINLFLDEDNYILKRAIPDYKCSDTKSLPF